MKATFATNVSFEFAIAASRSASKSEYDLFTFGPKVYDGATRISVA